MSKTRPVFLREATGLVRELSAADATLIGIQIINYGAGALFSFTWSAFLYPGAIVWLAFALGAIPLLFHGLSWGLMGSAMPRSGADYVWVSRLLKNGAIGFAITAVYVVFLQLATGGATAMISYDGLYQLFWQLGYATNSPAMLELSNAFVEPWVIFVVGTIVHILLLINCILPLKRAMAVMWGSFVLGNIGYVLMLWLLATTSHAEYVAAFNQVASYSGIMETAKGLGFSYTPAVIATLGALPLAFINMTGYAQTGYVGGEVKRAQSNLLIATIGSLLASLLAYVLLGLALENTVGMDFVASAGYLFFGARDQYPAIPPPIPYFLASVLTKNPVISVIISGSMIFWLYGLVMVGVIYCSRTMFAWAFDRIMPQSLAYVSERWHSPVVAVVIQVVLLEIGLAIATIAPIPLEMSFVLAYLLSTGCVTSFVITLFPWLKKDMFKLSPSLVKRPILGIPFVSICGGISFVWLLYLTYLTLTDPALGGTFGLGSIIGAYVLAFVAYFAVKFYRKKEGIDLELSFKEVPPE